MVVKKLVASTVSSRIAGIRRQNEKRTTSSHERKTLYKDQQKNQTNGKCGGRQGLSFIDGDVPQCMRSREAMIDEPKKVKGSSKEANEGSDSKARTRIEAKSEIEVNDTSSSRTKENNSQRETEDEKKLLSSCYRRTRSH